MKTLSPRLAVFAAFLAVAANSMAQASSVCDLIAPSEVERIVGAELASRDAATGVASEDCTYTTTAGALPMGMFFVRRVTAPVPAGQEQAILMSGGAQDHYVPVPGLGRAAVLHAGLAELAIRKGKELYHVIGRGIPCKSQERSREARRACLDEQNAAIKAIAQLLP